MFLPIMYYRPCYVGIHFAKIIHLFQMSKEMDKIFLSEPKILTFAAILLLCAFTNAEWLTPDEREPPAFSSPAVESIGGILREGGIAVCCIYLLICPADVYPFMSVTVIFM